LPTSPLDEDALTFERNNATHQHLLSTGDYVDARRVVIREDGCLPAARQMNLTGAGDAEQVTVGYVTPQLFPVLGVTDPRRVFDERDGEAVGNRPE
jgi:hypothetical protein